MKLKNSSIASQGAEKNMLVQVGLAAKTWNNQLEMGYTELHLDGL